MCCFLWVNSQYTHLMVYCLRQLRQTIACPTAAVARIPPLNWCLRVFCRDKGRVVILYLSIFLVAFQLRRSLESLLYSYVWCNIIKIFYSDFFKKKTLMIERYVNFNHKITTSQQPLLHDQNRATAAGNDSRPSTTHTQNTTKHPTTSLAQPESSDRSRFEQSEMMGFAGDLSLIFWNRTM